MKLPAVGLILAASAVVWTGCVNPDGSPDNTGSGALLGGALGAITGAAIGGGRHGGQDALLGAAAGAIAGGLIGHSADQEQQARLRAQAPQTYVRVSQQQPLTTADVKALVKAGIAEDVVINQIASTHTGFRLSSADIIDLRDAGVSDKIINFMINTATDPSAIVSGSPAIVVVNDAPPPAPVETITIAQPGPDYIWVSGDWVWNGRWVWVGGHWAYPPHPHGTWVAGYWVKGPHGWYRTEGYWR
jgi:outer membrane lipoprotein SlyB